MPGKEPEPNRKTSEEQEKQKLKDLLYDAYGVCSYLKACANEEIQGLLNEELLEFCLMTDSPYTKTLVSLMQGQEDPKEMLEILRARIRAVPKKTEQFESEVWPEFAWADRRMHQQNPKMKYSPLHNLEDLFTLLADGDAEAAEKIREYASEYPSASAPAASEANRKETGPAQNQNTNSQPVSEKAKQETEQKEEAAPAAEDEVSRKERVKKILKELDEMTGLESVKKEVHGLADLLLIQEMRKKLGLKNPGISRHMIFYGNPGTGKTTVARLLGRIYRELGLLEKGQLVETDRSGLVAGYVGQTAQKTQEMIKKALGGILFIDEAYSLIKDSPNDFGKEAVETLLKEMEDHREDLVVIAAGYPKQMDHFLSSNPGLASRFGTRIHFDNYSAHELMKIAEDMCSHMDYRLDQEAKEELNRQLDLMLERPDPNFGNARSVRNLLEKAMMAQAERLMKKEKIEPEDLSLLTAEDLKKAS